jgi:hypothetical protein
MSYWLVGASSGSQARLGMLLLASVAISGLYWIGPLPLPERDYNFEMASRWIAETAPSRMTFFWDAPTAFVVAEDQMSLVGGFFSPSCRPSDAG